MIEGIGIDLVEIKQVKKLLDRQDAFYQRILTPNEQAHYSTLSKHRQLEFVAGRYAAKEAFSKAMGTGIGKNVSFQDIEVLPNEKNKPIAETKLFAGNVHLSISHTETYAVAQVILEKNEIEG